MGQALTLAMRAARTGEVPVGAIVVHEGVIIGRGANSPIAEHDPTAHAEILALREAAAKLGDYRLNDCDLYVTLEPCMMCAGAILHARVRTLWFGASDDKAGACGSVIDAFANGALYHQTTIMGGIEREACASVLREFFAARRVNGKTPDPIES